MKCLISKHNSKILNSSATTKSKPQAVCNCRNKQDCPVPGQCNQATVTSATGSEETYVDLATIFKKRYPEQKNV